MPPQESLALAVLFADISQSSRIYELLGDQVGQRLVSECVKLLEDVISEYNGEVVKTIGDGVMCTFPEPHLAANAAKSMQEVIEENPFVVKPGFSGPSVKIGIHWGPVIREAQDVFGDAVNIAARIVDIAKGRQILTTEETVKALTPEAQTMARSIEATKVKGKRKELNIYELIWEETGVTIMMTRPPTPASSRSRLELRLSDQVIEMDRSRPAITMGRDSKNDLVVTDVLASRNHALIEYRHGRFVLRDQSTNGTYISKNDEQTICLHLDELQLSGTGLIALGRPLAEDSPIVIHFTCKY